MDANKQGIKKVCYRSHLGDRNGAVCSDTGSFTLDLRLQLNLKEVGKGDNFKIVLDSKVK